MFLDAKDRNKELYFRGKVPIKDAADWVEKSFKLAYAANPQATLILNDYNQIADKETRTRF